MKLIETPIRDLLVIEPKVFEDARGYFFEAFNASKFKDNSVDFEIVQDNESLSCFGVIRGLHYQLAPYAQAKLVRVVHGAILDVALDIRKNSPTYGKYYSHQLSAHNKCMMLIPKGFAHGFAVLSPTAIVNYKCDSLFNPSAERGVRYNDPALGIDWQIDPNSAIVSAKDKVLPLFESIESNFIYGGVQ